MSFEEKLGALVLSAIEHDDESQPYELGCALTAAHEKMPVELDDVLIALCGWRFETMTEALNQ